MITHEVSEGNIGEICFVCGEQASHKVEEVIPDREYVLNFDIQALVPPRHPLTTRLCCEHFWLIMGGMAQDICIDLSKKYPLTKSPKVL